MTNQEFQLQQTLFKVPHESVQVKQLNESELTQSHVGNFLENAGGDVWGMAAAFGRRGVLASIALATTTRVLHIRMTKHSAKGKSKKSSETQVMPQGRELLLGVLCHSDYRKLAFDMYRIAAGLYMDYDLTMTRAVDLQSMLTKDRNASQTLLQILGGEGQLHKDKVLDAFLGEGFEGGSAQNVALRAWASCRVASVLALAKQLEAVPIIDTNALNRKHLALLARFIRDAERLHALKPTRVKNDVSAEYSRKSGNLNVDLTRFKTRLRSSSAQTLVVDIASKGGPAISASGRTVRARGKSAQISLDKSAAANARILSVWTIGRDDPTPAETERLSMVLAALQRRVTLFEQDLFRRIFMPVANQISKKQRRAHVAPVIHYPSRPLNGSQTSAVHRILSDNSEDRVCLVHGPPGTGKTTVIAASVTSLMAVPQKDRGIWLVAQSNVAVKNIAEKLASIEFWDFKILVSMDFHFEWHEHLYAKVERNVIRSDQFAHNSGGTERLLLGSKVILCTLSMLSHPRLASSGFTRLVPIHTVIVDEASQIELGDYLPMLGKFNIQKLVFIGDNQQLAPYGQDDLGDLRSVFELEHLYKEAVFLDTQYRMPQPIGAFISQHIYDGRLQTVHAISTRRSCRLVDIKNGKEQRAGNSWRNGAEANAVVAIAKKFHQQGKRYCVITPYDGQRNLLEKSLKDANLPWENKCFNVDSFQGNEEDHIIISVVRSDKIGFLDNIRRTNVMLSRCKKSMIICSSRAFLEGKASSSLMGKLASEWGSGGWLSWRDVLAGRF